VYNPQNNSIIQAILMGTFHGQRWMNTIHLIPIDPPAGDIADGEANLDEIASILDDIADGWSFHRAVYTWEELTIDWLQLQYVWPSRNAYKRYAATNQVGTQAGDPTPPNVAAVYVLQSDNTGDSAQGTQHVCGLLATDVQDGVIPAIIRGHIETEADFLVTPFTVTGAGLDYELCIFRRGDPTFSDHVTHSTVMTSSRVLRRRTVGHGI